MKETVNVSIGSQAFTLDRDAYDTLRNYLDEIRRRLSPGDLETMADIETRIAEIFNERINTTFQVVSLELVRTTMRQLGTPDDFSAEPQDPNPERPTSEPSSDTPRRLYRSRNDRSIAGICGGLAEYLHIDSTALRVLMLFLILFAGLSIWVYLLLWLIIPEEPLTGRTNGGTAR